MWDLLIRGGRVIDPANRIDGPADVAVRAGAIDAVAPHLPREQALNRVDADDLVVLPGLVDLHTHVWHGGGYWGTDLEGLAWRTGVTTWVDAGSAGCYTLDGLQRHVADRTSLRVVALLNVSALGLVAETGEHRILDHLDVAASADVAARHGELVRGVKARIDARTVGENGLEPLRRARRLARRTGRPLMVHVGYGPPTIADIVPHLDEGDILTHCASGCPTDLVADGRLTPATREAVDRGVVFDLGHGSGAFDFDVLDVELAAGIRPTTSTDLHARSAHGPAFDMPTVMTKMLAAGLDLTEVVASATTRPAGALGLGNGVGTLTPGTPADIALFTVDTGEFPVVDVHRGHRIAPQRLRNVATYRAGRLLPPQAAEQPQPWIPLSDRAREAEAARLEDLRAVSAPRLSTPEDFDEPFPRGGETR